MHYYDIFPFPQRAIPFVDFLKWLFWFNPKTHSFVPTIGMKGLFVSRWNRVDEKFWRENGFVCCLVGREERKLLCGAQSFFTRAHTKIFFPKWREKRGKCWGLLCDKNTLYFFALSSFYSTFCCSVIFVVFFCWTYICCLIFAAQLFLLPSFDL